MLKRIPKRDTQALAPRVLDLLAEDTQTARRLLGNAEKQRAALQTLVARLEVNLTRALEQAARQSPIAPDMLEALVERELERLRRAHSVTLRVHPEDLQQLQAPDLLAARAELQGALQVIADPSLGRGECWLESDAGQVDARVQTRLRFLAAALLAGLHDD